MKALVALVIALLGLSLPQLTSPLPDEPSVQLPPDLDRVLRNYEAAWSGPEPAVRARLFSPDGFVLTVGRPPIRGRAAIEKYYSGPGAPLALRAMAYRQDGQVAFIIGGFAREKGQPDRGKFTLTLEKDATGAWLIVSDMDSTNHPPQS